jgi:lysophospholipase L1-like esterase
LAVAIVLLSLEGVARLTWRDPVAPRERPLPSEWEGLPTLRTIRELAQPRVRAVHNGVLYETNRYGFRDREFSKQKPPGAFRITVIGDSLAMGAGVPVEERYSSRLEQALGDFHKEKRLEVLNLAQSGMNATAIVKRLSNLGVQFDPDLVVYGFTLNDIEGPAYRETRDRLFYDQRRFLDSRSYLWRLVGPRWASLRELVHPPKGSYIYELNENYFRNARAWELLGTNFDRLLRISRERDICVVVLIHAVPRHLNALHPVREHYDAVARLAEQRGFHAVRSLPVFLGQTPSDLWVSPVDSHPNSKGHELLTEALLEGLDALPDTCWNRPSQGKLPATPLTEGRAP